MAIYIRSNNPSGRGEYHLASAINDGYVTACTGKEIGGDWGVSVTDSKVYQVPRHVCRRCAAKAAIAEFAAV